MSSLRHTITQSLWDNSIRIDHIIWLAGSGNGDINRHLTEFLEDDEDEVERLLGRRPSSPGCGDLSEYLTELHNDGKTGYLVEAATPIMQEGGFYTWGSVRTKWFYFEEWDETAVAKAMSDWADTVRPENTTPENP